MNLKNSGLNSELLETVSLNETISFSDLLNKKTVTFFTNWHDFDTSHFPKIYGSGISIPGLDSRDRYIIYCTPETVYYTHAKINATSLTWKNLI